jgi:diguanylate cyclase (GGDEF)-like protein
MSPRTASTDRQYLEDYADLIQRLLPSAPSIAFLDRSSRVVSNRGDDLTPDMMSGVSAALAQALHSGSRPADSIVQPTAARRIATLILQTAEGAHSGACVLAIRATPGRPELTIEEVREHLAPALACVGRELLQPASRERAAGFSRESASELKWLLEVVSATSSGADHRELLSRLMRASVAHLGCELGAVLAPGKPLSLARSAGDQKQSASATLRRLQTPILDWMERHDRPLRINSPKAAHGGFKVLAAPVTGRGNRPSGVLVFLRSPEGSDFTREDLYVAQHLSRQAAALLETHFDAATGLHTRAALQLQIDEWPDLSPDDTEHCVVHLNLDRLHVINETLGFDVGDELIRRIARLLEPSRLPPGTLGGRIAGDVFVIVSPGTHVQEAARAAEALQETFTEVSGSLLTGKAAVTFSCGIATFTSSKGFPQALTLAELACKTAKDHGRGRIEIYTNSDHSMIHRHDDLIALGRLQDVLRENSLTLFAQKILPLQAQGALPGYELLLRALDETHENRAPASLFSAAQRYQMESAIDAWVIEYALAQAARYRADLLAGQISLSINISGPSLIDESFLELTKRSIERSHLVPSLLTFEITETAAVSSPGKALDFIREMRAMGCRFALDDFGTGVNSFNCLKSLPVDRVKIDGSFVTDLLTNPQSAATVRAISGLAREMGIETVAEYAEDEPIITRLRALGIDYAQGYGVEKPRPFSEVLESLRTDQSDEFQRMQLDQ